MRANAQEIWCVVCHYCVANKLKGNFLGPIIRVNPSELSINDPEYYNTLYVTGAVRKTNAWPHFGDGMDFNGIFSLVVPALVQLGRHHC